MKTFNDSLIRKMERLANITICSLRSGKLASAKRSLLLAEDLLQRGNLEMKNAITNIYLYTVSGYLELHHYPVSKLLPVTLHSEYVKQVNGSGV
ncbi:DUF7674 family protein [Flavobacterium kingsejongi]|uniref:DUF7674 domain-containing protein n=1 Tax=Flavobacterium kingsejongi TaxID=1678728 RepID=A0A2S1LQW4_9FLAO|nr:hypothetical protein [Flavobacterium kingsejongi]AWG26119.1 hypothetical protein FK004_13220 [Flavobacterium kingsejongi]